MRAYFDTSLIVTLTLTEDRWTTLASWITATMPRPFYSDFGWGEYLSAIGAKVRRGEHGVDEANRIIEQVEAYLKSWTRLTARRSDLPVASEMVRSFDLALRFPDAIHIAIAQRGGCTLVTGDRKQYAAALYFGVPAINPCPF